MIFGISIPIGFKCIFRGERYKEAEVYFSIKPVTYDQVDLIEPGKDSNSEVKLLIKKTCNHFDYLIPYKITEGKNYDAPYGVRWNIGLVDGNPTTATMFNKIGLMPCTKNNLDSMLSLIGNPDFYIGVREEQLYLYIKSGSRYEEIPSQSYSPSCWRGFAHPSITLNGAATPFDYEEINWTEILHDLYRSAFSDENEQCK